MSLCSIKIKPLLYAVLGAPIIGICLNLNSVQSEQPSAAKKIERTLGIIKPGAVCAKHTGNIIDAIEKNGFTVLRLIKMQLTKSQAEKFYAVHKEKKFFKELVNSMIEGPVVVIALEQNNAIKTWRELMGDTNPAKAAPNTLRRLYGTSIGCNAVHGSDSQENASKELAFFFPDLP